MKSSKIDFKSASYEKQKLKKKNIVFSKVLLHWDGAFSINYHLSPSETILKFHFNNKQKDLIFKITTQYTYYHPGFQLTSSPKFYFAIFFFFSVCTVFFIAMKVFSAFQVENMKRKICYHWGMGWVRGRILSQSQRFYKEEEEGRIKELATSTNYTLHAFC